MLPFILAFLIGLVAGLQTFVALAAVSWAAYFGHFPVAGTHFAFMGDIATPIILTLIAIAEIVYVEAPRAAVNSAFAPKLVLRIFLGLFVGAVIGSSHQTNDLFDCAAAGAFGAIIGTFGCTLLFELLQKFLSDERRASIALSTIAVLAGLLVLIPLSSRRPQSLKNQRVRWSQIDKHMNDHTTESVARVNGKVTTITRWSVSRAGKPSLSHNLG